jgi:hypothetical protein
MSEDEKQRPAPASGVEPCDTEPAPPPPQVLEALKKASVDDEPVGDTSKLDESRREMKSGAVEPHIAAPLGLVKGGTTSAAYDEMLKASEWDANRRRATADRQAQIAQRGARQGEAARLGSTSFLRGAPRAVFFYLNRDGTIRQECVSEITMIEGNEPGKLDLMFTIVCPRCLERGVPQGHSQCQVRSSHRRFHIREDPHTIKMGTERVLLGKGQVVKLSTPDGQPWPVIVCGSITCDDVIRCDNYNCDWAVRIDESRVYEV